MNKPCTWHNYLASVYEEQENTSTFKIGGSRKALPAKSGPVEDPRKELLRESNLRNVVELFEFDPDAPWFGHRGMTIESVSLLDENGNDFQTLDGGEQVVLRVAAKAMQPVKGPIAGFYIKDRLGQQLFGDNTYLSSQGEMLNVAAGEAVTAEFHFQMPFLPTGDFSITVAIAEGTQESSTQHHWIDDALFFRVHSSHVSRGLIGVPMAHIEIRKSGEVTPLKAVASK